MSRTRTRLGGPSKKALCSQSRIKAPRCNRLRGPVADNLLEQSPPATEPQLQHQSEQKCGEAILAKTSITPLGRPRERDRQGLLWRQSSNLGRTSAIRSGKIVGDVQERDHYPTLENCIQ